MSDKNYLSKIFLGILLFSITYACYLVFKPFLGEFLIAIILVTILYKPFEYILKFFKGRKMIASFVMCLLVILLIIIPLFNFITYSAQRSITTYTNTAVYLNHGGLEDIRNKTTNSVLINKLKIFGINEESVKIFVDDYYSIVKNWVLSKAGGMIIMNTASNILTFGIGFIFSIIIIIFSMFFFFMDGKKMAQRLMYLTPFPSKYDKEIFQKFKDVSYSTIISTFITAIAQGLIGAIGFLIVGFPIFFPSMLMSIASIIPYLGTALIWLPVGLYLLAIGNIWQGIFIFIWGSIIIGNSDNIIRAYLIKDKAGVHPLFIFFSIIGGLSLFGFWGIIYGPLIVSLTMTILHIYEMEYAEILEE